MNNRIKCFKILSIVELISAAIFSFFNISFHTDVSILAFPLSIAYTCILIYFSLLKMIPKTDGGVLPVVSKMSEYLPYLLLLTFILRRAGKFGTSFGIDVIQVLLWCILTVCVVITTKMMSPKRVKVFTEGWTTQPVFKKYKGWKKAVYETVDWIDSIVWAVFTVLLIQIFVFQLYEIPSESMVPTFLIKDKVIVSKIDCGPKFPLTDVGLPDFRRYKKGDTIVLRNPHYSLDRKSEVKTVVSQMIYMLTIMQVNLNKDENGDLKADPLVKRIVAEPGEQVVMQDGVLYYRTKDHDFEPSKADEKYAAWNINKYNKKAKGKQKIQYIPFTDEEYQEMLDFEAERRSYDLAVAEFQAKELVTKFKKLSRNDVSGDVFSLKNLFEYNLFSDVMNITKNLMVQKNGTEWFEEFMLSWIDQKNTEKDMYSESNYKLNVMTKIVFGNLVVRYAELFTSGIPSSNWKSDIVLIENLTKAETLNWYIQFLDERNMPVFPANDSKGDPQYIPNNCYFMMGDNRFNSLDLRHSMEQKIKPLSVYDSKSIEYYSMMEPQYINKKYIIGKPIYRFMPVTRRGKV